MNLKSNLFFLIVLFISAIIPLNEAYPRSTRDRVFSKYTRHCLFTHFNCFRSVNANLKYLTQWENCFLGAIQHPICRSTAPADTWWAGESARRFGINRAAINCVNSCDYANIDPREQPSIWLNITRLMRPALICLRFLTTGIWLLMELCQMATNVTLLKEEPLGDQAKEQLETLEVEPTAKQLDMTRFRVKKIEGLEFLEQLEYLCLRWNLIKRIENLHMLTTLTELDLYDNQIEKIEGLETLVNLHTLDLSFNRIQKIEGLKTLVNLHTLYLVHNKLSKIEGLENLEALEYLELGDNRIKKIENLDNNVNIRRLFLGANQIRKVENIGQLQKLDVLSMPANIILKIEGLDELPHLKELYFSQNGIQCIEGLEKLQDLEILDLNHNRLKEARGFAHLQKLTDFWAKMNKLEDWSVVDEELVHLPNLRLVYLEENPFSKDKNYRARAIQSLSTITRLDSDFCRKESDVVKI
ncbi:unnamed protein product, partial [Mesorhabditis belari]|uniref:Protein phosphatase 1 regulatory subunit 7 n=2 Tax=Mesorhabditis belari TaxID=2138241 RepID=A0AAF3FNT7_9BILA